MQHALLDVAVRQDREREHERRLEAHELHAADGCGLGVRVRTDHHRGVRAHPREQLARLVQQVVEHLVAPT